MTRRLPTTPACLALGMFLTALAASSPAGAADSPDLHQVQITRPESSTMIIEFNSTDQDVGVQFFFDAEGWTSLSIFDPSGNAIYTTQAEGRLARLGGGSEFSLESDEPALADLSFAQFFRQFPAGTYRYIAETPDGESIYGKAEFTHQVPAGPEIVTPLPQNGENCAQDVPMPVAIAWNPVTLSYFGEPIDIKGYEVVIEADDATFDVHIPASAGTAVTVTPETLHPGTRYTFEVLAIETGGNQTITSGCFKTAQ